MKKIFLALLTLTSIRCIAQTPDSSWLMPYTIEKTSVQLLRAPADKITLRTKLDILSIQKKLDKCKADYEAGKQTYKSSLESEIEYVGVQTPEWPVAYYQKELEAYLAYNKAWNTRDVARVVNNVRTAGYVFVSVGSTPMTEKPWGGGMAIADLRTGSYLLLVNDEYNKNDTASFIHVIVEKMDGYVRKADVVNEIGKLVLDDRRKEFVEVAKYYDYTQTPVYKAKEQKEMAARAAAKAKQDEADAREDAAINAREAKARRAKYHWGPKGGCYFINSNGKKQYVEDKSLCR